MTTSTSQTFETVIGLEVHLQLYTDSKIFSSAGNEFGCDPNTRVTPVCLGLPGTLPVLNKKVLDYAIKVALALNCEVSKFIKFDRKNYYYPDLPKGYQISQFDHPIAHHGHLMIPIEGGEIKRINITRAHLEEDAGKLIHDASESSSLVDYNRTGTPLIEIVSEPDLRSPQEAYDYLNILKLTLQYLNVSDCDMEKGSLRCDANVSIRKKGDTKFGTKTEIKNMNSFRAVKAGLEYEVNRQVKMTMAGEKIIQETRLWNETKGITASMRSKEESHDYRYFPEPDLVPFTITDKVIDEIRSQLPELPEPKFERLMKDYKISDYDAKILIQDQNLADYFEECAKLHKDVKKICNWINGPILSELKTRKTTISEISVKPQAIADIIKKVDDGSLSNLAAKDVLKEIFDTGKDVEAIIQDKGLAQVSDDSALEEIVDGVIKDNEKVVNDVKSGKDSAIGFLIGQAMKKSQGKANPKKVGDIIRRRIQNG